MSFVAAALVRCDVVVGVVVSVAGFVAAAAFVNVAVEGNVLWKRSRATEIVYCEPLAYMQCRDFCRKRNYSFFFKLSVDDFRALPLL